MDKSQDELRRLLKRWGWLYRVRPQVLVEPIYRLLGPYGGRSIISHNGAEFFIDPFTTDGFAIIMDGDYESNLMALMQDKLPKGGIFLDVGANEGRVSAVAARLVGKVGCIIAVEPQSRLQDLLKINLALNATGSVHIFHNAIGKNDGDSVEISLAPTSHHGGSSIVRKYRWSSKRETISTRSIDSVIDEVGCEKIDMMKVDVEGYEAEVIDSAANSLAAHRINTIALDYHGDILRNRGIDPMSIDAMIRKHGYRLEQGSPLGGYTVYSAC